ncbi:type III-A CRISPR-associated RAMP protein Csm5 [Nitratiruptor sp. YY09-18]|uniref:type III-A CRISPR-associated RAMP protein Csm5 n=1 Tax=Nitratiruptor sp. YY09-18 TaxID=2724901 RepID=UPI001915176F|nr:type III-A CRISPR-associated RAMP protein Csm5 [Nitratiruptor sp. YY09-18]BCD68477.1 CRISPR-associated protein Csm5 [Nitratiruptor sp. YY09-18]
MKKYRLKLTALTPIHIGTGEVYEPTNFIIDDGYLYEFDEIKFYKNLPQQDKEQFKKVVSKSGYESLFELHKFIKSRKEYAKKAYIKKVQVTKSFAKDYEKKIGRADQNEGGRRIDPRKVFNRFEIEKTIRFNNRPNNVYIPGSSLKGSISTAYQEYIYKKDKKKWEKWFKNSNPSQNLFKELSIADAIPLKAYSIIGYALNKERFEEDDQGPTIKLETIFSNEKQQSIFETDLTIKDFYDLDKEVDIKEIQKACNEHYLPIFEQMFKPYATFKGKKVDDFTNEYYSDAFYEKYKNFKPKENQFLIRVGKYSQARAVTIDGMRKIRVKVSGGGPRRKPNKWETLDQETTTWMFGVSERSNQNLLPFGWVLCEVIDQGK